MRVIWHCTVSNLAIEGIDRGLKMSCRNEEKKEKKGGEIRKRERKSKGK
jgi:hypothetical protein